MSNSKTAARKNQPQRDQPTTPLAERMRPARLDDFVGQRHLLADDKLLAGLSRHGYLPSLLLWGPPGSGKTTLARILAGGSGADFVFFSAVLSGVKEIREIVERSRRIRAESGRGSVLFVDEIHRFNKSQQDAFLPHVEAGLITLIGATTENPSFHVIAPLLSRCRVIVLNPLAAEDLQIILERALSDEERGLGKLRLKISREAADHLISIADGDARSLLNSLEIAAALAQDQARGQTASQEIGGEVQIGLTTVEEAIQRHSLRYDADGEEHYNLISALHKSLRDSDPDGALYWLGRMLAAGEEPLYIARRLIRFASEDIGNADPQALGLAVQARESYHLLGSPEGELALAQAVVYLATAPKSNAVYAAYNQVLATIKKSGSLPVPLHLRNAPTKLMRDLNYGKDYQYAHDDRLGLVDQQHLPDQLAGTRFYHPTNRGHEALVKERLEKWRKILAQRKKTQP
ncbi:replication-associated recombination protein A [Desulfurivibrio alkaliphilus]|uniref:Replication-associated recombination protein A n=1 Tax=Desulfurivibrio alkaliphilus (strain DSM 19089 / UNIQEM U267 / AHT2) TaxID=589865 RepID=D6Z1E2_DESAT|nr:replication-associated recombination protein A [Desulfurivibrio alkaliphilus]ADH85397.1 AAA ATPase central domain protein [Desulfurivibrio alkaliphilus AHT 2]